MNYSEMLFNRDKQLIDLLNQKDEEIERLNNIINELEEALKDHKELKVKAHYGEYYVEIEDIYNYLQKLKGSDKE